MAGYIVRRLLWAVVVVACVLAVTFAVFYLLPAGDPALRFAGKNPNPQELLNFRVRLGLDKPWWMQFLRYVGNFFTGDRYGWPGLGYTFSGRTAVKALIVQRAPRTLFLIAGAAIIWLVTGVTIGICSAVQRRPIVDRLAMTF